MAGCKDPRIRLKAHEVRPLTLARKKIVTSSALVPS